MKIRVTGILVKDQESALKFYTEKLGFVKKRDIPLGNGDRWLTVVSKEEKDGTELLLEPLSENHFKPAQTYQEALFDAGLPCTQFYVENVQEEYERLINLGVEFSVEPTDIGTTIFAIFNDTCGNNIQIVDYE
ncbi:VOC family protein [Candidatus Poribacteria bacterium]|nr:VOC family protein [Candidatus Poribacteria bacterium]